jgi:hypothetical protein
MGEEGGPGRKGGNPFYGGGDHLVGLRAVQKQKERAARALRGGGTH